MLFLFNLAAFGQERELLKGKLYTHDQEIFSINIVNLTNRIGTTNKPNGEFQIEVALNDTLLFSSIQYEAREIVITEEVLKKAVLTVLLVDKIDELKEVSISNISLTGILKTDLPTIPTLTPADLGFPMSDTPKLTSIERKLKTASNVSTSSEYNPPGMINISLDGILNKMNGKTEMLEKAAANEDLSQIVDAGIAALSPSFFIDLAIPEDRIRDFVYFCAEDENFQGLLPETERLHLVEFYLAKAPVFIKERM